MPTERSTAECLTILGAVRPKLSGKSQAEVDAKLEEWKSGPLRDAYKAAVHRTHPDKNPDVPDAAAQFAAVVEAYEQLQTLKVNLKKPEKSCPSGHERLPATAKYCHECGYCYEEDALTSLLKSNGITERTISLLRDNGEFDRLKGMSPFSEALHTEIALLKQRQRLGLFGRYSGWG